MILIPNKTQAKPSSGVQFNCTCFFCHSDYYSYCSRKIIHSLTWYSILLQPLFMMMPRTTPPVCFELVLLLILILSVDATFVSYHSPAITKCKQSSVVNHRLHMMGKRQHQQRNKDRRNNRNNNKNNKKKQSLESLLELETDLHSRGFTYVVGSDDSGGAACIAGPVVVASCCVLQPYSSIFSDVISSSFPIPTSTNIESEPVDMPQSAVDILRQVNDCKVLTSIQRQEIYDIITEYPNVFAITTAYRSAQQIAELNLMRATQEAFAESIETLVEQCELPYENCYAIVDGKVSPKLYADKREEELDMHTHQAFTKRFSVRPYVNGDAHVFVVALASIVARITREKMMKEVHTLHPDYSFNENNGYGTKDHIDSLHRLGSIEGVHRLSFKQVTGR